MADRETHVANFFETELTTELGPTDLVAEVMSTGGLQPPAFLVIEPDDPNQREVILFDGAFSDTQFRATSIANRYLDGSAQPGGLTHPAGSVVRSAPLAQHIQDLNDRIDAVEEATVGTAKLADGAVTTPKLADGAVTAAKIADGAILDKIANEIPRGVLGYAFRTSSFTISSGTVVDLPGLSVQVTVPAGRVLRVIGFVRSWAGPSEGGEASFYVREGAFTLHNKRLVATNGRAQGGSVEALILPSAGTHTYKLSFDRAGGTSDWTLEAFANSPAYILVEDLGADPNA